MGSGKGKLDIFSDSEVLKTNFGVRETAHGYYCRYRCDREP